MEEVNYQFFLDYAEDIVISLGIHLLVGVEIWLVNKVSAYVKNRVEKFDFQDYSVKSIKLLGIGKQRLFLKGTITFTQIVAILLII